MALVVETSQTGMEFVKKLNPFHKEPTTYLDGWSLLLCHGAAHDNQIKEIDPERTFWVDKDETSKPDMALDIFKIKCRECRLFDRVLIIHCPMGLSLDSRYRSVLHLVDNLVSGAIKIGGIFYMTDYFSRMGGQDGIDEMAYLMKDRGFIFLNKGEAPELHGTTSTYKQGMNFLMYKFIGPPAGGIYYY